MSMFTSRSKSYLRNIGNLLYQEMKVNTTCSEVSDSSNFLIYKIVYKKYIYNYIYLK